MNILFLRVGIDRGCGGTLSPRFSNGTFEFVPIPEFSEVLPGRGVTYDSLPGRHGDSLAKYSGSNGLTHYDPEFSTYTYGEPSEPKRSQLLRLRRGDYLVFYAGFQGDGIARGTCFIIGYFHVEKVHAVPLEEDWPPLSLKHLHHNAHFRRRHREDSLVIVEGSRQESRLFNVAKQLSDERQRVLYPVEKIIGFGGSVKRAIGRWVPNANAEKSLAWLSL